jgi:hypothetical protein
MAIIEVVLLDEDGSLKERMITDTKNQDMSDDLITWHINRLEYRGCIPDCDVKIVFREQRVCVSADDLQFFYRHTPDSEYPAPRYLRIEKHLDGCERCRRIYSDLEDS